MAALRFAWKVVKHVKSNAIVFARAGQTVGVGAGQMSRVDSVKIAAMKAQLPLDGHRRRLGRLFPVSRRRRGSGQGRRHGGDSAGRLGARQGSDRSGEPSGPGDGHDGPAPFLALDGKQVPNRKPARQQAGDGDAQAIAQLFPETFDGSRHIEP